MAGNAIVVCTWSAGRDGLPEGAEEILHIGRGLAGTLGKDLNWLILGPLSPRRPAPWRETMASPTSSTSRMPNSTPLAATLASRPSRRTGPSTIRGR